MAWLLRFARILLHRRPRAGDGAVPGAAAGAPGRGGVVEACARGAAWRRRPVLRVAAAALCGVAALFATPICNAVQYQIVYVPVTVMVNGKAVVIRRPVIRPVPPQPLLYTLGVQPDGAGTVTSTPPGIDCGADCSEAYAIGTAVTLNAAPAAGSSFSGWSGDCAGTAPACTVTLDKARSVTASFVSVPPPSAGAPTIGGCPLFPDQAIFNVRIDDRARFPAHAQSDVWVNGIGGTRRLHADWGVNDNPEQYADYYGIPYNVVDGSTATTAWPVVSLEDGYPEESDCAVAQSGGGYRIHRGCHTLAAAQRRFPFPLDARIKLEGGACNDPDNCGDRHVLVLEQGACRLWESWFTYKSGGVWSAGSTAAWDLRSHAMRPVTWTSADAAGLPILPLLARVDEASAGEVRHALRVTFRDGVLAKAYVWPGRHRAGGDTAGGIPFGALLRLKSSFVVPAAWTTQAQALARAMQRYGLYVADIGSDLYVQGEPSARWDAATISQLQSLPMNQFEFVDTTTITRDPRFDPDSLRGAW